MAQDEHFLSNSNSGGGGIAAGGGGGGGVSSNRSKNAKPKKVPQRGLGVAQLEKIRLEEQRKREALQAANALANNAIGSGCDSVQSPNLGPNSIPLSPSRANFVSPNSSWPRLWSGEYNLEGGGGEKQRVDHVGFTFGPQGNVNLQYEYNGPVLPISSNVPQRLYQFQRPAPPPPSVANASSGISPSSVSSSQIEPPSIQSVRGNSYTSSSSSWPEDDKIIGMKRSYPFSLEPSFLGNFHHTYSASRSRSRSDELPSCSDEPRYKDIRDGPLNSTPGPEQNPSEDVRLIGDFLTLAPPPVDASPPLNSRNKHPLDYLGHQGPDLSDHRNVPTQENIKSSQTHETGSSATREQPFSFFPIKPQTDIHVRNGNEGTREKLDLNLKL